MTYNSELPKVINISLTTSEVHFVFAPCYVAFRVMFGLEFLKLVNSYKLSTLFLSQIYHLSEDPFLRRRHT